MELLDHALKSPKGFGNMDISIGREHLDAIARWEFTWIVWPVAGVLFGAVAAILKGVMASGQKD